MNSEDSYYLLEWILCGLKKMVISTNSWKYYSVLRPPWYRRSRVEECVWNYYFYLEHSRIKKWWTFYTWIAKQCLRRDFLLNLEIYQSLVILIWKDLNMGKNTINIIGGFIWGAYQARGASGGYVLFSE